MAEPRRVCAATRGHHHRAGRLLAAWRSSIQQVRGPHFTNLDSSILKNFNFTESTYLQFRAEAFNTTNTPPFAQPRTAELHKPASFSNISATKNSNENNGARTLQLALKLFY